MLIGIVSKDAHIKNHSKALREEGYEVLGLGSSPTEVPPTVDLLVLRTQSCSHGGSNTAYAWSRATKKPLIVENGLSGIRSKLRELAPQPIQYQSPRALPALEENMSITSMLEFPKTHPFEFFAVLPEFEDSQATWDLRHVPKARLVRGFVEALEFYRGLTREDVAEVRRVWGRFQDHPETSSFPKTLTATFKPLRGRPLSFFIVAQWCLDSLSQEPTVLELQTMYQDFSGASSTKSYVAAATWAVKNQVIGPKPEFLRGVPGELLSSSENCPIDEIFMGDGGVCVLQSPGKTDEALHSLPDAPRKEQKPFFVLPPAAPEQKDDFSKIRSDLEDFILDITSNNQELLSTVKSLREEISALRKEVSALRKEVSELRALPRQAPAALDPFQVLLGLRDQGARITISLGDK